MGDISSDTGLRTLWPRLLLATLATLLVVIVTGIGLARLLPARQSPQSLVAEQTPPPSPIEKPTTPIPPHPDPPRSESKPVLPLLDNPPPLPPPPSEPVKPPSQPAAPSKPLDSHDRAVLDLQVGDEFF